MRSRNFRHLLRRAGPRPGGPLSPAVIPAAGKRRPTRSDTVRPEEPPAAGAARVRCRPPGAHGESELPPRVARQVLFGRRASRSRLAPVCREVPVAGGSTRSGTRSARWPGSGSVPRGSDRSLPLPRPGLAAVGVGSGCSGAAATAPWCPSAVVATARPATATSPGVATALRAGGSRPPPGAAEPAPSWWVRRCRHGIAVVGEGHRRRVWSNSRTGDTAVPLSRAPGACDGPPVRLRCRDRTGSGAAAAGWPFGCSPVWTAGARSHRSRGRPGRCRGRDAGTVAGPAFEPH